MLQEDNLATDEHLEISKFSFRKVKKNDRELISNWLSQDYVQLWLHGDGLKYTLVDLEKFINGESSDFCHWIVYENQTAFAYILTSDVIKSGNDDDDLIKWCSAEGRTITLDLIIGNKEYVGRGFGPKVLQNFLLSQSESVDEALIDPEVKNDRAVKAYKKAGFEILGEFVPKWNPVPHYMMRLQTNDLIKQGRFC